MLLRNQIRIYCANRYDKSLSDNHPFFPGVANLLFQMSLQHFLKLMLVVFWYLSFFITIIINIAVIIRYVINHIARYFHCHYYYNYCYYINSISVLTQKSFTNFKITNWWSSYLRQFSFIRYIFKSIRSKYAEKPLNIQYCNDDKKKTKNLLGLL